LNFNKNKLKHEIYYDNSKPADDFKNGRKGAM